MYVSVQFLHAVNEWSSLPNMSFLARLGWAEEKKKNVVVYVMFSTKVEFLRVYLYSILCVCQKTNYPDARVFMCRKFNCWGWNMLFRIRIWYLVGIVTKYYRAELLVNEYFGWSGLHYFCEHARRPYFTSANYVGKMYWCKHESFFFFSS